MESRTISRVAQVLQDSPRCFQEAAAGWGVVQELEEMVARWIGVRFAVGVASGTLALYFALKAAGVEQGDEVVLPAYDWFAAAAAVLHLNAVPVFADVDELTYTISPRSVSARLSPRTRAVVATHLFGHPCDMATLKQLCRHHALVLVEDAAQALGASVGGRRTGSLGDIACFSFGPGKIVSAGEGGIVATDDEVLASQVLALCSHPLRQAWGGVEPDPFALRAPLNPLGAAFLVNEWGRLEERLMERRRALEALNAALARSDLLHPVFVRKGYTHAVHRVVARVREGVIRDRVVAALQAHGIPACPSPLSRTVPSAIRDALARGRLRWHPYVTAVEESASRPCPVAEHLCRTLVWVDWRLAGSGVARLVELCRRPSRRAGAISDR